MIWLFPFSFRWHFCCFNVWLIWMSWLLIYCILLHVVVINMSLRDFSCRVRCFSSWLLVCWVVATFVRGQFFLIIFNLYFTTISPKTASKSVDFSWNFTSSLLIAAFTLFAFLTVFRIPTLFFFYIFSFFFVCFVFNSSPAIFHCIICEHFLRNLSQRSLNHSISFGMIMSNIWRCFICFSIVFIHLF